MPNDIHELTIVASVADQFVENVLHFQNNVAASTQPGTDSASLIAAFQADVEPTWLACLADDYGLQGYRCKRVNNSGGPSVIVPRSGVPGSFGTNSVTSGQGACIISSYKYIPSIGSDKYRTGRIFMPGSSPHSRLYVTYWPRSSRMAWKARMESILDRRSLRCPSTCRTSSTRARTSRLNAAVCVLYSRGR